MTPESLFFLQPEEAVHKRYEALRSFYVEGMTAREVSAKFGYRVSTVYALARDFKLLLSSEQPSSSFFIRPQPGRKEKSIDRLIEESEYPETKSIPKLNALLSFVALKLSNVRRYTADDLWCMDRGLGLFAGLNVLPKAAWYTSYSHRVTRNTNLNFLKSLAQIWIEKGLGTDTANLDFTTIPYWGSNKL